MRRRLGSPGSASSRGGRRRSDRPARRAARAGQYLQSRSAGANAGGRPAARAGATPGRIRSGIWTLQPRLQDVIERAFVVQQIDALQADPKALRRPLQVVAVLVGEIALLVQA